MNKEWDIIRQGYNFVIVVGVKDNGLVLCNTRDFSNKFLGEVSMVNIRTWEEFRESGMLWFINRTLHIFGWSIVFEYKDKRIANVYPARVKYRGFDDKTEAEGFIKVSKHMKDNAEILLRESMEE